MSKYFRQMLRKYVHFGLQIILKIHFMVKKLYACISPILLKTRFNHSVCNSELLTTDDITY